MDQGKIVQIGTPKELLYRPASEFVSNFFAKNRLLLEYKVTTLQELQGIVAIDPFISQYGFTLSTDLWHATQVLSMHTDTAQAYETLVGAFNNYRKQQVV